MKRTGRKHKIILLIAVISMAFCLVNIAGAAVMPSFTRLQPVTSGLSAPTAVALDKDGCILVIESANNRLLVYSQSGEYLNTLSGLNKPVSIAVDDNMKVYIGNKDTGNVEVYDSGLNFLHKLGTGDGEFVQPNSIALSDSGNIYVVDSGQDVVKVYNPDGSFNFSFGGSGSGDGQFNFPTSVAVDETAGEVIVSDLQLVTDMFSNVIEGARIQVFDMSGVFQRSFGAYGVGDGLMGKPMGVAVDNESRIFVTDSQQHIVHVFDSSGTFLGALFDIAVPLRTPLGINISSSNKLHVASLNTGRVEIFGLAPYTDMSVSPLTLSFEGMVTDTPAVQNIEISNNAAQVLNWTATQGNSWITLSQTSGSADPASSSTLNVGVNLGGLSIGEYTGSVIVRAESGDTETVNIELTVLPTAVLSVTPEELEFTSVNGSIPAMRGILVANAGEGSLNWTAVSNDSWISIDRETGTEGDIITVSADPSSKSVGTYSGTITITSENAVSSPVTVDVTLNVVEETGTINVSSNIPEAAFIINGPESFSGGGTSWSTTGAVTGKYTIVFGYVDGYTKPFSVSKILDANGNINFTGNYTQMEEPPVIKNIITGAGPAASNNGLVKVFDYTGNETGVDFAAHAYGYGVNVAAGDVNCDGVDEIITAPGPGSANPAEVRIFDQSGSEYAGLSINAFAYNYGANVASGDFNGDGYHEVVAGAGAGAENPAYVKIFVFDSGVMADSGINLLAYGTGYGVSVSAADVDNDGVAELITAPGPGEYNNAHIKIWDIDTSSGVGSWTASLSHEYTVQSRYGHSVSIAGADVNGDGYAEVITGAGPHRRARDDIRVFDENGQGIADFVAYIVRHHGANATGGDLDGDGAAEIVIGAGPGPGNRAVVKIFDMNGVEKASFEALDTDYGVNVAVGKLGLY